MNFKFRIRALRWRAGLSTAIFYSVALHKRISVSIPNADRHASNVTRGAAELYGAQRSKTSNVKRRTTNDRRPATNRAGRQTNKIPTVAT